MPDQAVNLKVILKVPMFYIYDCNCDSNRNKTILKIFLNFLSIVKGY